MTIDYDPKLTTQKKLAKVITELGYNVEQVEAPKTVAVAEETKPFKAPMPQGAPEFFRDAFDKAHRANQPLVVDFWAAWCAPCLQLKKVTFHDPRVAQVLERVQLIYVDLDKYPALGTAYGVQSVPDVFFINREGFVVDRLHNFEPPDAFLVRLKALVSQ